MGCVFRVEPMPGQDGVRFRVVDSRTGKTVDDRFGFGFKTEAAAAKMIEYCGNTGIWLPRNTAEDYSSSSYAVAMMGVDESGQSRFHIVEIRTGRVVDDASGRGYRSEESAKRRMLYQCRNGGYAGAPHPAAEARLAAAKGSGAENPFKAMPKGSTWESSDGGGRP